MMVFIQKKAGFGLVKQPRISTCLTQRLTVRTKIIFLSPSVSLSLPAYVSVFSSLLCVYAYLLTSRVDIDSQSVCVCTLSRTLLRSRSIITDGSMHPSFPSLPFPSRHAPTRAGGPQRLSVSGGESELGEREEEL
mmetsp:Transcript_41142/g.81129  ORF Transcript_41142/g.81129 Transcript_41142/m.81129 type:complete len:135 (+) Transcript_41142:250-654(+)